MGGGDEHLCHLREQHQLSGIPRKGLCRRLECLRLQPQHTHSVIRGGAVFRTFLPQAVVRLRLLLSGRALRRMGTAVCLGLLSAHAGSPNGQHSLSVGAADERPDGVGDTYGNTRYQHCHTALRHLRRHTRSGMDRGGAGNNPHRGCFAVPRVAPDLHAGRPEGGS